MLGGGRGGFVTLKTQSTGDVHSVLEDLVNSLTASVNGFRDKMPELNLF